MRVQTSKLCHYDGMHTMARLPRAPSHPSVHRHHISNSFLGHLVFYHISNMDGAILWPLQHCFLSVSLLSVGDTVNIHTVVLYTVSTPCMCFWASHFIVYVRASLTLAVSIRLRDEGLALAADEISHTV